MRLKSHAVYFSRYHVKQDKWGVRLIMIRKGVIYHNYKNVIISFILLK